MNEHIFQAFRDREKKVLQYVLGTSASSLGADCSCGDPSKCHCNKPRLMKKQRSKRLDPMMNMTSEEINKHLTAAAFGAVGKTNEQEHFGRAMSGLSALSIDWDNIDDFDVNVDHSAHITNSEFKQRYQQQQLLAQANSIRPQYALEEEDDMFSAGIMAVRSKGRSSILFLNSHFQTFHDFFRRDVLWLEGDNAVVGQLVHVSVVR